MPSPSVTFQAPSQHRESWLRSCSRRMHRPSWIRRHLLGCLRATQTPESHSAVSTPPPPPSRVLAASSGLSPPGGPGPGVPLLQALPLKGGGLWSLRAPLPQDATKGLPHQRPGTTALFISNSLLLPGLKATNQSPGPEKSSPGGKRCLSTTPRPFQTSTWMTTLKRKIKPSVPFCGSSMTSTLG